MIRRQPLLQTSAALLAAPVIVERANAQSVFDWMPCKGLGIEENFQLSPRGDRAMHTHPRFGEPTGIKVATASFQPVSEKSNNI